MPDRSNCGTASRASRRCGAPSAWREAAGRSPTSCACAPGRACRARRRGARWRTSACSSARPSGRAWRPRGGRTGRPARCSWPLDPPPLGWAAAVVRDRRHVGDRADLQAGRLQGADRRLATGARPADENLDRAHTVLESLLGGGLGGGLGGKRRRLAAALEALRAGRAPGDHVAVDVADRDDRVVERALDMRLAGHHVLALAAPGANDLLLLRHYLPALTFFLPATARLGPRRLRAFVRVRWPRTGRPRRCRWPRYEPISVSRLMFIATSRRRSPSMRMSLAVARRSTIWRRRPTSSSLRSLVRLLGSTLAFFTIFSAVALPMTRKKVMAMTTRLEGGMSTPAILAI